MNFSFLNTVTIAAVEKKPTVAAARPKKQYQPLTADLRIWASGAIYPSDALNAEFLLEYQNKDAENKGFGIDIIETSEMPAIKSEQPFIAISFTQKDAGKVDIFASVGYNEDGTPKVPVTEQGAATFGKETLLPMLERVYGIKPNEEGFIDLLIMREHKFESANGIYQFPKQVSRGEKKGEMSYVRRENQAVFPLVFVPEVPKTDAELSVADSVSSGVVAEDNDPFADDVNASIPSGDLFAPNGPSEAVQAASTARKSAARA